MSEPADAAPCAKCGGPTTIAAFAAFMNSGVLYPPGKRFTRRFSRLRTVVCLRCGYTEWYAEEPDKVAPDSA